MLRPYRIVIIGHSLADLKQNMLNFVNELDGKVPVTAPVSQSDIPYMQVPGSENETMGQTLGGVLLKKMESPFGAPPPMPSFTPPHIPEQVVTSALPAVPGASTPAQYDAKGMPWDERIHSATAAKTKDGAWRYRRGVEDDFINTIEAELRSQLGQPVQPTFAPPPIPQPVAPPTAQVVQAPPVTAGPSFPPPGPAAIPPAQPALTVVPPLQPNPPVMASQPVQPVGPASPAPAAPQPVVIPAAHSFETFKELFIPTMGKLVADKKIDQAYVNELKKYFKVDQLWELNDQQKLEMFETFVQGGLLVRAT